MTRSPESQAPTKTTYIFIGEQHDDFSNVSLVKLILESCEAKGLKAAFYPEDDSQLQKMGRFTDDDTGKCGAINLPDNWKDVVAAVDDNPAHNKKMHLVGNRVETVFDPFYESIAGVRSNEGKFTDATGAFSEVMRKITDSAEKVFINPAFLNLINSQVAAIKEAGHKIDEPKNFGRYVQGIDDVNGNHVGIDHHILLSSLIADRMVGEIKKHQGNEDVAIILTGNNHSENVATKLGIPKSEMVMISNCENEFADAGYLKGVKVLPFDVNNDTKIPTIPSSIAEKLTELQISKAASVAEEKGSFVKKLGLPKPDEKPPAIQVRKDGSRGGGR
jgi:hypothetical protein